MTSTHLTALAWLLLSASGLLAQAPAQGSISYRRDIQPILEKNCVICHSCYDAPCQLKMETPEGLDRGATKAPVYKAGVKARETTRINIDAGSTEEWRRKGFFSVLEGGPSSLLGRMLELGKMQTAKKANQPVPSDVVMGLARVNECPTRTEFDAYSHRHMHEGMPFGMAPLVPAEYKMLQDWLAQGSPIDGVIEPERASAQGMIDAWEKLLNRTSPRDQLLARYLYEHLFIAHLYLDRAASSGFFELVRSTTPPGTPIEVVPTRRPTDEAGDFYYRLRPHRGSIVEKTHVTYDAGPEKLARVQSLFSSEKWTVDEMPAYQRNGCSNPFKAFEAIPARLRYQFMLDDAHYFVQCFIRGPVCLGQVATDVIEDHFFTLFQKPESDRFCTDAEYAATQLEDIDLDGRDGFSVDVMPKWMRAENRYSKRRTEAYKSAAGPAFSEIWDGNADAAQTIYRNFDSATVVRGLRGRAPKTMWVMDYPIFERIYYLLVVNFDVFGAATHQVGTRLYFDLLRAESEVNFLRYLPREARKTTLSSWYKGTTASLKTKMVYPDPDTHSESQVRLGGGDPKEAFIALVRQHMPQITGAAGDLSAATASAVDARFATADSAAAEAALAPLAEGTGADHPFLTNLPETTFIRVEVDGGANDLAYTLNRVKWHSSVAFMFRESSRLDPKQDYLELARGPLGCYPNFIFHVKLADVPRFVKHLKMSDSFAQFESIVDTWGVRRTHPSFWADFKFFRDYHAQRDGIEAGIFDANRYENF